MEDLVKYFKREYAKTRANCYKKSYSISTVDLGWAGKGMHGGALDIHKLIGKIPKPQSGRTPSKYKYIGLYNSLYKQLTYDKIKDSGEVLEWKVQPYNKVDEIAAYRDICYDMGKNKDDCDRE